MSGSRKQNMRCRRVLAVALAVFLLSVSVFPLAASAAVPRTIMYQSRLTDTDGDPITTSTTIQFSVYDSLSAGSSSDSASEAGPLLWKETWQVVPDDEGYFSVRLGSTTVFPSYMDFSQPLWLGVKVGSDSEASPRAAIDSAPFALNSDSVDGIHASSAAEANKLLSLDANLGFDISTGAFSGGSLSLSSTTAVSSVAGALTVTGSTTLSHATSTSLSVTTLGVGGSYFSNLAGAGLSNTNGALTLDASGNWTGTLDGEEGSYYLNASNLTNFGLPFYTFFSATNTDALAESATRKYYATSLFNTDFSSKTTDDLTEGATKKYYSSSLFNTDFGGKTTDNLTEGAVNKYYATSLFNTDFSSKSTDNLAEGSTNLYYTTDRFGANMAGTTTDALAEGDNNLYYTTDRFAANLAGTTTDAIDEGENNLYYTVDRFNSAFDTRLSASSSVSGITALPNLASVGTITSGTWQGTAIADGYLTKSGDWTGTLDGQEGSYYLNASNLTNFGLPFYTFFSATNTDALAESATRKYYATSLFNTDFSSKTTDDLTEGATKKYYADSLARNAISSLTSALSYNNTTGEFTLAQAGAASDGYLSSTDWNTFNNKVSSQWAAATGGINYAGGNVGVGTDSPGAKVDILASTYPVFRITRSTTETATSKSTATFQHRTSNNMTDGFGVDFSFQIRDNAGVDNDIALISAARDGADNSGAISLWPYLNGTRYERMRVTSAGNVGIGTTSPYAKLSVDGRGVFNQDIRADFYTATSTTASSTFPYLNATQSDLGTVVGGTWQGTAIADGYLTKSGDWTGTLDGQEGSYYLNASNLTNFGLPFYTFFSATTTDALAESATRKYYATSLFNTDFSSKTTDDLTEGATKKYYADSLARNAISSLTSALSYNNTTGEFTLAQAGAASDGYLSSTDWNTFNNKVSSQWAAATGGINYAGGNVGIATSSPYAALSVVGETVSTYFTATSTLATSTLSGGLSVAGASGLTVLQDGRVGVGTSAPGSRMEILDSANPQLRLSQTNASVYTDFTVAPTTGDLTVSLYPNTTANDITLNQPDGTTGANLWVCQGTACPSAYLTLTNGGNIVTENSYYFGNGFRISNVDASTTAVYDTTNAIILQFDETP